MIVYGSTLLDHFLGIQIHSDIKFIFLKCYKKVFFFFGKMYFFHLIYYGHRVLFKLFLNRSSSPESQNVDNEVGERLLSSARDRI